jgi:hypothetical protein
MLAWSFDGIVLGDPFTRVGPAAAHRLQRESRAKGIFLCLKTQPPITINAFLLFAQ